MLRVMVAPRIFGESQVMVVPARSAHKATVVLKGLTAENFKAEVLKAIVAATGEILVNPGGVRPE